jgi:uncharacterized membrane protein YesL
MNFEKLVHSKVNDVADWIIRIVTINILIVFTSLIIVTIYPAVSAGYNLFHDYIMKRNPKLFKGYFGYFKEHLVRKMILTVIIGAVFTLGYLNIRYYSYQLNEDITTFDTIGYYITIALVAIWYAITLHTVVIVRAYPTMNYISIFKLSFFIAGKYYFITMLIVVISSFPLILLYFPQIFFIFIFGGISIPLVLHALLTRQAVLYIESLGEQHD